MSILLPLFLATQGATIVVDPHVTHGVWEGWGASLCWMGNVFGNRDDLADLLFTTKTVRVGNEMLPGLGMNIVRYNAGACSTSEVEGRKMVLSSNVLPYRQLEGFWLDGKDADPNSKSWDWSRDASQRAMMLKAKRRGADRFELFSNSPMWWMCANDNPSGAPDAMSDNLRPDMQEAFAVYLATIAAQAPRRWGVSFTSVEPFNEPASDYWDATGRQEGCHFSPATQATFLPKLRAELDRQGLTKMPIASSDETSFDQALSTWAAFDGKTKTLIDRVNVHGYKHTEPSREQFYEATRGKALWNSEHGDGDAVGTSTIRELSLDLTVLHATAWCYWQPFDGGGWGLLDCDMVGAKIRKANPKLFAIAQYTRHIRPGMTLLETNDPHTAAAYDPKRRKLVIVTENSVNYLTTKTLDFSRFTKVGRTGSSWLTELKGTSRYKHGPNLALRGKTLTLELPPSSVRTVEIGGADL